jgi:hypothetical protein
MLRGVREADVSIKAGALAPGKVQKYGRVREAGESLSDT